MNDILKSYIQNDSWKTCEYGDISISIDSVDQLQGFNDLFHVIKNKRKLSIKPNFGNLSASEDDADIRVKEILRTAHYWNNKPLRHALQEFFRYPQSLSHPMCDYDCQDVNFSVQFVWFYKLFKQTHFTLPLLKYVGRDISKIVMDYVKTDF